MICYASLQTVHAGGLHRFFLGPRHVAELPTISTETSSAIYSAVVFG